MADFIGDPIDAGVVIVLAQKNTGTVTATSETTIQSAKIPANSLGPNGLLEIQATIQTLGTNDTKTIRWRIGSSLGSASLLWNAKVDAAAVQNIWRMRHFILNRNATNSQYCTYSAEIAINTANFGAVFTTFDTTVAQTLFLSGQLANSLDSIVCNQFCVILRRQPP